MPRAEFIPYRPKTILNAGPRADHWFWTRYSAYPYRGCQHGCIFCYCREQKYAPAAPDDFAYHIQVKENAPELLRKALSRKPVDVVFTGDYQAAERKFQLSRRMLEVCLELGFPVFILSRSPLVLRDLDLIQAIHAKVRATVAFSLITAPASPAEPIVRRFERLAPPTYRRLQAMQELAAAGIPTGACLMPLLPGVCDTDENLRPTIAAVKDAGGSFVLASSLTLADQQRQFFFDFLQSTFPALSQRYAALYPPGSYGPRLDWHATARRIRALCAEMGLPDRQPRPIIPGEKLAFNKRIVERLANACYTAEIENAPQARQWQLRKAAWAVEDLETDLRLILRTLGRKGLESIPGIGPSMALEIEQLAQSDPTPD